MGCVGCGGGPGPANVMVEHDDGKWRRTRDHLGTAVCPGCPSNGKGRGSGSLIAVSKPDPLFPPSNERWAREMVAEYANVQQAKATGRPVPQQSGETRLHYWVAGVGWTETKWEKADTFQRMIDYVPPSRVRRVLSYLAAKIPHLLGIRASRARREDRKARCLGFGVRCGQCGKPAEWDADRDAFTCKKCHGFDMPRSVTTSTCRVPSRSNRACHASIYTRSAAGCSAAPAIAARVAAPTWPSRPGCCSRDARSATGPACPAGASFSGDFGKTSDFVVR